jgi:GNAT superfamily N-acetyltransferase
VETVTQETNLTDGIAIEPAVAADAWEIANLHLESRRAAMPYLKIPHTDDQVRAWFARAVANAPKAWWIACAEDHIAGYMLLRGEYLDHLYVLPGWQRRGVGLALLNQAKALSPKRISLSTFQRNSNARRFYEAHGFFAVSCTDGRNEEHEPDVQYVWAPAL